MPLHTDIKNFLDGLKAQTDSIGTDRKELLKPIADYLKTKLEKGGHAQLNFICTHNSRRSHLCQIWCKAVAYYYGYFQIDTFSGGTEATAFYPLGIAALGKAGFQILIEKKGQNPLYLIDYGAGLDDTFAFSKKYDDAANPKDNFAAIMTCDHASENCPVVFGAEARFNLWYEDPKAFDGTEKEAWAYENRSRQIATEMLWMMGEVLV